MTLLAYVRSNVPSLFFAAIGALSACGIAAVCGCTCDAVCLMLTVLVVCGVCACAIDFMRSRGFYGEIKELGDELERPYQLHSIMSEPFLPDHALVYRALKAMGVASAREVAYAKAKADEHREFVEGWVHGVKAPLTSCELIAERVTEPERSQLVAELDRIRHKVDAALWYARSDCAHNDYVIREMPLVRIPRQACRENARYLIDQGCMPVIDIDEAETVFTDKKQAAFIVAQFVENAAKYGAHHVRFSSVRTGMGDGSGRIELRVEDDGRGIPAEDIDRVFERGFTGTRGREGMNSTGIGLYLAARLCKQLGLGLSISSVDGEGTCVTLAFPLDRRRYDVQCDESVR